MYFYCFSLDECSGTAIDWVYNETGLPYAFTIEMRPADDSVGFLLPENQIIPTSEEVWAGIVAAIKAVK